MINKRKNVGVIGSGSLSHATMSIPIGRMIAKKGYNLITGGGGGVMEATSKAFSEAVDKVGLVLGILPSSHICNTSKNRNNYEAPNGYPNKYIDIPIRTHLHLSGSQGMDIVSRNHIIILTADIIIALPGGAGTRSEIKLALEYKKPLIILNPNNEWNEYKDSKAIFVKSAEEVFNKVIPSA